MQSDLPHIWSVASIYQLITVKSESNASLHLNTRLSALHYFTKHVNWCMLKLLY